MINLVVYWWRVVRRRCVVCNRRIHRVWAGDHYYRRPVYHWCRWCNKAAVLGSNYRKDR